MDGDHQQRVLYEKKSLESLPSNFSICLCIFDSFRHVENLDQRINETFVSDIFSAIGPVKDCSLVTEVDILRTQKIVATPLLSPS